jgi:hypothetical protein
MNSQTCPMAPFCAKIAVAMERAGLTEVLVTGIEIRWMSVRPSPMAIGAKPAGTALLVEPRIIRRNAAVRTISATSAATIE